MDQDHDLSRMLEGGLDGLGAPVADIVAASTRLGRRRRLYRRLRMTGAALTVAAVVATGAALGLQHGVGGTATVTSAATGPGGRTPVPAPTTTAAFTEPATAQLTPEAMIKILADQLPPGAKFDKFQHVFPDLDPAEEVSTFIRYDDGHGLSTMQLTIRKETHGPTPGHTPGPRDTPLTCEGGPQRPAGPLPGPLSCVNRFLPDGSWELVRATDAVVTGLYGYQATIWRPNGDVLTFFEFNGTINAYGHKEAVNRDAPPVALAAWQAIAENPKWQFKVPQSLVDAGAELVGPVPHAPFPEG